MERMKLEERINAAPLPGCREPKIPHSDIVKAMVGLLCMGKPDYDAIEAFRDVPFSVTALGLNNVLPARPFVRGWMWFREPLTESFGKSRRD